MKNLLKIILVNLFALSFISCKDSAMPVESKPVSLDEKSVSGLGRNLISKYTVVKSSESQVTSEFEILFEYDKKGVLLSSNRIDKRYNSKTGLLADEHYSNRVITNDANGLPIQMKISNTESVKNNAFAVHDFIYSGNLLTAVYFTIIKDDKLILKIPKNMKLNYNIKNQLASYQYGGDKGHDFIYKNDIHSESLLPNSSNYDFEYSPMLSPSADYKNAAKYIISQTIEAENSKGFGITSSFLPSKIVSKSGDSYEFNATTNSNGFPTKITEKFIMKDGSVSKNTIITNITYSIFED